MTTNKRIVQLSLISFGLFLILATYFFFPKIIENKFLEKETIKDDVDATTITHNLFARKKERGVVVMTEAASIVSDENKNKRKNKVNISTRHEGSIHKIKED